jgi:hypothetical protein
LEIKREIDKENKSKRGGKEGGQEGKGRKGKEGVRSHNCARSFLKRN